jgi:SRSO17 transposase
MEFNNRHSDLRKYLEELGSLLNNKTRVAPFAAYFIGLMSSLQRKTAEGIATLYAGEENIGAVHQRLVHFLAGSAWSDRAVRRYAVDYALRHLPADDPVQYWIVDDTGFIKKGTHSVGVQRQYTGTSGKVDNCQIGVSLTAATGQRQLPLSFDIYLGKTWIEDPERRVEAKIPKDLEFRTKPQIATQMISDALEAGLPRGIVLADHAYGNNGPFRRDLAKRNLDFSLDIGGSTRMWRLDATDKRRGRPTSAESLGRRIRYTRVTWAEGTRRELASRFAFARVVLQPDTEESGELRPLWCVIEDPYDATQNKQYFVSTLPASAPLIDVVRTHMNRWRTERMYQDMKGVFGLDHYEGRSYPGWHHHASMAMAAYAFSFAEQARLFPPAASRPKMRGAVVSATGASLRRFDDFDGTAVLWGTARMVAAVSGLPPGPL